MAGIYSPIHGSASCPGLATALGDMMLAWTDAERAQSDAFAVILNTSVYKASRLYQKLPNFRSRTQALFALIELHPQFASLQPVIAGISGLSKTRNDWVHGSFIRAWGDPNDIRAINLDENTESPKRSKPIKAADIHNHAEAVRKRALQLHDVLRALPEFGVWSEAQIAERKKGAGPLDTRPESQPPPPDIPVAK